jgi:NAD(P)-dependent dehydrogenase (short-subunit alcohol dehydrogenase family)
MLTEQKVVVIGRSSGMGLATAKLLARKGAHVVIASRSKEKLEAARAEIEGKA